MPALMRSEAEDLALAIEDQSIKSNASNVILKPPCAVYLMDAYERYVF